MIQGTIPTAVRPIYDKILDTRVGNLRVSSILFSERDVKYTASLDAIVWIEDEILSIFKETSFGNYVFDEIHIKDIVPADVYEALSKEEPIITTLSDNGNIAALVLRLENETYVLTMSIDDIPFYERMRSVRLPEVLKALSVNENGDGITFSTANSTILYSLSLGIAVE